MLVQPCLLAALRGNDGNSFAACDIVHPDQVQRVGQGIDDLPQVGPDAGALPPRGWLPAGMSRWRAKASLGFVNHHPDSLQTT